jgi:hypothetical protein
VPSLAALQPDGSIAHGNGAAVGSGTFNTTGAGQSRSAKVGSSATAPFAISIQNAGDAPDSFLVSSAAQAVSNYTVSYSLDGADITSQVVDGTFSTPILAPGESLVIDARVSVGNAGSGSKVKRVVTLTSQGDPTKQDAVSFLVRHR